MSDSLNNIFTFKILNGRTSLTISNESIVLDYLNGEYFELDKVGGFIWKLIQTIEGITLKKIVEETLKEYEALEKGAESQIAVSIQEIAN